MSKKVSLRLNRIKFSFYDSTMCYYFWVFGNRRTNRILNGYQAAFQHHWNVIADPVFKIELDKNCMGKRHIRHFDKKFAFLFRSTGRGCHALF